MTKSSGVNAALFYLGIAAIIAVSFLAGCNKSAGFRSADYRKSVQGNQILNY